MSELHDALSTLRPKDFSDVPTDQLDSFCTEIFSKAELIANSVPSPPGGSPYESSKRSRSDVNGATSAADLTISTARRSPPDANHEKLQKSWGKPLSMSSKDKATGISVYKMAGHDRHGAWFARSSVHEGLGFTKWKKAMMREFPESLAVQGGPGEGNIRGIGGDQRLEDIEVKGIGKMEVYQLSAQFPGPVSPREFITLLLTSDNCLSEASKVGNVIPRHFMVVSIPVDHPEAPPRDGLIRGSYESIEMIREIPLTKSSKSASTNNLLTHKRDGSRNRSSTVGFAESRGPEAKGERIDRQDEASDDDPETNPVEWLMVTRSDPGGGIPRFMVERNTPSSIVADAIKFLNWACGKDDFDVDEQSDALPDESHLNVRKSVDTERAYSISQANGILAGVGTSIADKPAPATFRRYSRESLPPAPPGVMSTMAAAVESTISNYAPNAVSDALLHRTRSRDSTVSSDSSDSFASATQFNTAPEGLPIDDSVATPSTTSSKSLSMDPSQSDAQSLSTGNHTSKELQKIEERKTQLKERLEEARTKQNQQGKEAGLKSAKELERATERHNRERKKQEDKYAKEVQKLEARRERETKKLLARQQKEADKNTLLKTQRERDEWKQKAELWEQENKLLKEQIGELQKENTAFVARLGKTDKGLEVLKQVREELEGKGRKRASSRASEGSNRSNRSGANSKSQLGVHEESGGSL